MWRPLNLLSPYSTPLMPSPTPGGAAVITICPRRPPGRWRGPEIVANQESNSFPGSAGLVVVYGRPSAPPFCPPTASPLYGRRGRAAFSLGSLRAPAFVPPSGCPFLPPLSASGVWAKRGLPRPRRVWFPHPPGAAQVRICTLGVPIQKV